VNIMPCPDLVRVLVPELVPLLTGYTQAALAALVHLLDAWHIADDRNRPHAAVAILSVLSSLMSPTSQPLAWYVVVNRVGLHGARALVGDLECASIVLGRAGNPWPPRFWLQQFGQAAQNAPAALGVYICCGRRTIVDGVPGRHLGGQACEELGQ
jgi:hypothetical protein